MSRWLIALLLAATVASGQRHIYCHYENQPLPDVFDDLSLKFGVRYSFADQALSGKSLTLEAGVFALSDIHRQIENQTGLHITKIDERYYAVSPSDPQVLALREIVVENYLSRGIVRKGAQTLLFPGRIEELPGITDADVLFSLQQLPGVKSPYETATGLFVRGGTPDQNLVLWDGIRIYHPGHLFGMVSPFNPAVTSAVAISDHGTAARYGERVSSVISMRMADSLAADNVGAGINGLNLDAAAQLKIGAKADVIVAARKSYTEQWASPAFEAYSKKVFQHTGFNDVDDQQFGFRDVTARVNFRPGKRSAFHLTGIFIDNGLDFSGLDSLRRDNVRTMDIRNTGASGQWQWRPAAKWRMEALLDYSLYDFSYQSKLSPETADRSSFIKKNRVADSGFETIAVFEPAPATSVSIGYQLQGNDLSHTFHNETAIADVLLDQRHLYKISHAGFIQFQTPWAGGRLGLGGRYVHYGLGRDQLEPRAIWERKIGKNFSTQVSYEHKSQVVSQIREAVTNDLSLENYLWVLADGKTYPVQRARQIAAGVTWKEKGWLIDAGVYNKITDGLTSRAFGFLRLSDTVVHRGRSIGKGLDLLVQKTAVSWRASASYSLQDLRNRYEGINGGSYFPASADIRHAFTVSAFKKWGDFSLAAGWSWHSGKPFSSVADGGIESYNRGRLAPYHRMDVSAAYAFKGANWKARAGVSILNLYGRSSVISREFEREYQGIGDFIDNKYVVRDYRSLGFTPNIFFRIGF